MYRPTVRYADEYKTYIDDLFHATSLDRNQILRCALFSAAYSKEFKEVISRFRKKDVPLPSPRWSLDDWRWWKFQDIEKELEGKDVNVINNGKRDPKKDGSAYGPRGRIEQTGNEYLQRAPIPGTPQGRIGAMASQRGKDVIRGTGGGITIRINEKNKSG